MSGRLRVGLTGGIGTGKTVVSDQLADFGARVIDADLLAREVVQPGTPGLSAVVARFGPEVLAPDGTLDRPALGRTVFADPVARGDLEQIVHPAVRARAAELEAAVPPGTVVVHVIPLLVETGQAGDFDVVVVLDADPETQLRRLLARGGLDEEQARGRVAAQASRAERLGAADVVLDNSGNRAELARQVEQLWATLRARAGKTVGARE